MYITKSIGIVSFCGVLAKNFSTVCLSYKGLVQSG